MQLPLSSSKGFFFGGGWVGGGVLYLTIKIMSKNTIHIPIDFAISYSENLFINVRQLFTHALYCSN